MNLSDWQALSGAYQPDRMARLEIAFRNLPDDLFGRIPAWAWCYGIYKSLEDLKAGRYKVFESDDEMEAYLMSL